MESFGQVVTLCPTPKNLKLASVKISDDQHLIGDHTLKKNNDIYFFLKGALPEAIPKKKSIRHLKSGIVLRRIFRLTFFSSGTPFF